MSGCTDAGLTDRLMAMTRVVLCFYFLFSEFVLHLARDCIDYTYSSFLFVLPRRFFLHALIYGVLVGDHTVTKTKHR